MTEKLEFGKFSVDTEAFELRRDGDTVPVEPLVLDLIIEMALHPGALRTRDDLIETVWKGRIVSDTTISSAIKSARKALGDTDAHKRIIRTVHGRGFQFVGEKRERGPSRNETQPQRLTTPVLQINVVPLDASISPVMARALDGRLRAAFNRIPFLNIAAARSASTSPGLNRLPATPTHHLEIALSSMEDRVYADVSLSDLSDGLQKWARHVSVPSETGVETLIFQIGPKAEPQILKATAEFLAAHDQTEPRALVLRAMQVIAERGWNPKSIIAADDLLDQAIAKDKEIPLAYAMVSLMNAIGYRVGMLRQDDNVVKRAIDNAELALSLEGQDSSVLGLTGCALCDVGQLARGEPIIDRALDLDPMNGHAYAAKGAALMMRGDFDAALAYLRKSIEISPADSRLAVWGAILAIAELKCGQLDAAQSSAEQAISRDDVNYLPRLAAVALYLVRQDASATKRAVKEVLRVHPGITSDEVLFFVGKDARDAIWPKIQESRA